MSEPLSTKIGRKALAAEKARLARFFQTINKHRKALDLAGCAATALSFDKRSPRV